MYSLVVTRFNICTPYCNYVQVVCTAHHSDSSLKSAKEMEWIHDPDDNTTTLPPPPTTNSTLNSFIHHSGHAVKPTEKIRETGGSILAKWSAVGPPVAPASKKALICTRNEEHDNKEEEAPSLEDFTDDEEDNENENEEAYQKMKKLGDQDCKDQKNVISNIVSMPCARSTLFVLLFQC
jgi:hypothetical protein